MNPPIQMNTNMNNSNQSPTITHHFYTQSTMVKTQPHSAQPLLHTEINPKQFLANPQNSNSSYLNDPSKQATMTKNNSNTNLNNMNNELGHNQNMINNFYQKAFFQQNQKYNPFPTLATNYDKNAFINASTRPPIPPTNNNLIRSKEPLSSNLNSHIGSASSSPSLITANIPPYNQESTTAKLFIRDNTGFNNTIGLPISLSNIHKTSPDLISNQSYMSSKFRKTKLW